MKKKYTKITELVISEENEELSIDAISLVTSPAIEVDFIFFGKEKNNLTFAKTDDDKQILISPALKHNNHHKATYQHEDRVAGVLTVESWIKEGDMDKSKLYGFDLPDGTWFVKMKIENKELWSRIKSGELKGLSIEGYFVDKMEKMSKPVVNKEDILVALRDIIEESEKDSMKMKQKKKDSI